MIFEVFRGFSNIFVPFEFFLYSPTFSRRSSILTFQYGSIRAIRSPPISKNKNQKNPILTFWPRAHFVEGPISSSLDLPINQIYNFLDPSELLPSTMLYRNYSQPAQTNSRESSYNNQYPKTCQKARNVGCTNFAYFFEKSNKSLENRIYLLKVEYIIANVNFL